jgi:outer membrane protein
MSQKFILKWMGLIFTAVVFVFFNFAASLATASGSVVIGVVSMDRAIQGTKEGQAARKTLDGEFQKRKAQLDKRKADIEKTGQDLEKRRSLLSEEVLARRQAELQEEMMKFQKSVAENQLEIQKKEEELVKPILDKMRKAIEQVAKDKGLLVVIENKGQVLFAQSEVDITDEVIKAYEKMK